MALSTDVANKLRNAKNGRYGVRVLDAANSVGPTSATGPFAWVQVITDTTFGSDAKVHGGEDLQGVTAKAGTRIDAYFEEVDVGGDTTGIVVAGYATTGTQTGQVPAKTDAPLNQEPTTP